MSLPISLHREILDSVANKRLLKHPFYQAWEMGTLPLEVLRTYARQYFHHVEAFPRYLSATHSNCPSPEARQVILENLIDEERGSNNHPELWLRFAEGIGNTRPAVRAEKLNAETQKLINTFMSLAKSSYAEGLAALYVYEEQTPEIAATKMSGLQKNYGLTDKRGLSYFELHKTMDIEHSGAEASLVDQLPIEDHAKAKAAAANAADALWDFLSGMERLIH